MQGFLGFILLLLLLVAGLFVFAVYFATKVLGFFLNATRLYRAMIRRQDATIRLLIDIRDNTKRTDAVALVAELDREPLEEPSGQHGAQAGTVHVTFDCPNCGSTIYQRVSECMFCKKELSDEQIDAAVAAYRAKKRS